MGEMSKARRFSRRSRAIRQTRPRAGTGCRPRRRFRTMPPDVFASAMTVRSTPGGEDRSCLSSSALPSGRRRSSAGFAALQSTLHYSAGACFRVDRGAGESAWCQAAQLSSASMRVATDGRAVRRRRGRAAREPPRTRLSSRRRIRKNGHRTNARSRVTRSRRLSRITRERSRYRSCPE